MNSRPAHNRPDSPAEEKRAMAGAQQSNSPVGDTQSWASGLWIIPLGWELAVPIVAGALLGHWLDDRYQSSPLWTVLALSLGTAAGFYNVWRLVRHAGERDRRRADPE